MALIRPSALVGAISGALAGVCFSSSRAGPIVRPRPISTTRRTEATAAVRTAPTRIAAGWQALTNDQRKAWHVFASGILEYNRLGVDRHLDGWLLYWRQAAIRYLGSPPSPMLAPTETGPVAPQYLALHAFHDGPYVITSWGYPYPDSSVIEYAYLSRWAYPNQEGAFKRPRRIDDHTKSLPNWNIYTQAAALNIDLLDTERGGLALRWQIDTGLPSSQYWVPFQLDSHPWYVDDFEHASFNPYDGDTGDFSFDTGTVYEGTYSLKGSIGAVPVTSKTLISMQGLPAYPHRGQVFDIRMYLDANIDRVLLYFNYADADNWYRLALWDPYNAIRFDKRVAAVSTSGSFSGAAAIPKGEWIRAEITHGPNATMTGKLYNQAGTLTHTCTLTDTNFDAGGIGYTIYNDTNQATDAFFDAYQITGPA